MRDVGGGWRRNRKARRAARRAEDNVHLDGDEHAWWAGRDGLDAGVPHGKRRKPPEPTPPSGRAFTDYFTTASLYEPAEGQEPRTPEDSPYHFLGVPDTATWEEITAAHRRLAKLLHPDRLQDATDDERSESEARIRDLNVAYAELRRRRGK